MNLIEYAGRLAVVMVLLGIAAGTLWLLVVVLGRHFFSN